MAASQGVLLAYLEGDATTVSRVEAHAGEVLAITGTKEASRETAAPAH